MKALLIAGMIMGSLAGAAAQQAPLPVPPSASVPPEGDTHPPAAPLNAAPQPTDLTSGAIKRVRAELQKPAGILKAPEPKADFSIQIEQRRPLEELFDVPPWATSSLAQSVPCPPRQAGSLPSSACGAGQGGGGTDVLPALRQAKRALNERAAREEVRREIAEFCAAQPNGGAGLQICTPPSDR